MNFFKGAPSSVVRKKYRELSKTMHPDKGGDPVQFDRIAKAYQALTDDESRENWEKYGNPDGPTGESVVLVDIYISILNHKNYDRLYRGLYIMYLDAHT